jgi:beta-glucosidase
MKNSKQHPKNKYFAGTSTNLINRIKFKLHFVGRKPCSDFSNLPQFPADFLWGVATSAYQVEGNITGNDWYIFTTSPEIKRKIKLLSPFFGREIDLEPAREAVHHGNIDVLKEDLDRARLLGMNAYRFSIEWSRIQPSPGNWDSQALKYYQDAIEEMHKRGLKPIATLNHLSLPKWVLTPPRTEITPTVEDQGFRDSLRGWENEETIGAFAEFVKVVVGTYMDRVDTWITLNEPVGSIIGTGYIAGVWPPGFNLDGERAKKAYFNLLKAHVKTYRLIKSMYGDKPSFVGIAHAMMYPRVSRAATAAVISAVIGAIICGFAGGFAGFRFGGLSYIIGGASLGAALGAGIGAVIGDSLDKHKAARNQFDYFYNYHFLDSVISGRVDKVIQRRKVKREYENAKDFFGIPEQWKPQIDFIGVNYYRSVYVYYQIGLAQAAGFSGGAFDNDLNGKAEKHNLLNDFGWEIYPEGLYYILTKGLKDRYHLPILITENGIPQHADRIRAPFIAAHLEQLLRAMKDGVDVRGYIHWSLLDNWELQEAYSADAKFGLFTVDRTANLDATKKNTYPRHITEGALALQYIIADGSLKNAVEKFGRVCPKGDRIESQIKTAGAIWEGILDDSSGFTLYLNRLQDNPRNPQQLRILGMIFYHNLLKWVRLERISWDGKMLEFSHGSNTGAGKREYEARAVDGNLVDGSLVEGSLIRTWKAEKVRLYGLWNITSGRTLPFNILYFSKMEGEYAGWSGKAHASSSFSWDVLDIIEWDGETLKFRYNQEDFTCVVSGDTMRGLDGRRLESQAYWEARKAPDNLPF